MEYCYYVWTGAPSCCLDPLDKQQKQVCRTIGPSFAATLEPLAYGRNIASRPQFCRWYFGICLSELAKLLPLPYSGRRSTCYFHRLYDFIGATIPRCHKDIYLFKSLFILDKLKCTLALESKTKKCYK